MDLKYTFVLKIIKFFSPIIQWQILYPSFSRPSVYIDTYITFVLEIISFSIEIFNYSVTNIYSPVLQGQLIVHLPVTQTPVSDPGICM